MHKTTNSDPEPTQRTHKEKGDKYFPTTGKPDGYCKLKRCLRVAAIGTQSKIAMKETIDMQDQQRQDSSHLEGSALFTLWCLLALSSGY